MGGRVGVSEGIKHSARNLRIMLSVRESENNQTNKSSSLETVIRGIFEQEIPRQIQTSNSARGSVVCKRRAESKQCCTFLPLWGRVSRFSDSVVNDFFYLEPPTNVCAKLFLSFFPSQL